MPPAMAQAGRQQRQRIFHPVRTPVIDRRTTDGMRPQSIPPAATPLMRCGHASRSPHQGCQPGFTICGRNRTGDIPAALAQA